MPTTASLSLDLDNKWAYLRTHGVDGWQEYPSYLPFVCERVIALWQRWGVEATVFVVGRDLADPASACAIGTLASLGYELANHSYSHYPWMESLGDDELETEVAQAETAIFELCGKLPVGFRAPGFSGDIRLWTLLARRGYAYDASSFPTSIGPIAARYARLKSLGSHSRDTPRQQFAPLRSGWSTLHPHVRHTPAGPIAEVPVTTMPIFRTPFHVTYLMYLAQFSPRAARGYLQTALTLCRLRGAAPSMLLHPLDFLGGDEEPQLAFFPGMKLRWRDKERLLDDLLDKLTRHYSVGTVASHAALAGARARLPEGNEVAATS
jgi:hypothetical protein